MRTALGDKILAILSTHVGQEMAITAPEIAAELYLSTTPERAIRRTIASEKALWAAKGVLVCASPGGGYYVATAIEEMARYWHTLRALRNTAHEKLRDFEGDCALLGITAGALEAVHEVYTVPLDERRARSAQPAFTPPPVETHAAATSGMATTLQRL